MTVGFFVTCLADSFYPRSAIASVKLLEHFGCTVEFPEQQTCCGQPIYNNGFHDEGRAIARRMIDLFEPYEALVTPSGSCAAMLRECYAHLFADQPAWSGRAAALAGKTYELIEFLQNELHVDWTAHAPKWNGSATYHYSCHLRGLGLADEAERVIGSIEGLAYRPLAKREQCCGFGGAFAIKYPQISGQLVHDKLECIQSTGAETLICNDAGCAMHLAGACRRAESAVRLISLAEVLAEGLGLLPEGETEAARA